MDANRMIDVARGGRKVDLNREEVLKIPPFLRSTPPRVGEIVLVDGARCCVTSATIKWAGPHWTLLGLRVKDAAEPAQGTLA